jgi:hypothetical protein
MNNIPGSSIKLELKFEVALLVLLFIFLIIVMYLSPGSFIGGDTYYHYQIARYAFKHPHLLLDHWGKPLFTLLFAPFAQFDYGIAKLLNVFIGVLSAYMTFLTAQKLNHKICFPVIFLILFSPIYFIMLNSVMTEILFGFFLVTIAYLSVSGKLSSAALLFSFLPFVRTEGFILLFFFGLFLLFKRKWLPIMLLLTGFLIYSLVGKLFYYHDFFWVFTKNPYPFRSDIYGHGDFLSYFSANKLIWGIPQSLLLVTGIIVLFYNLFSRIPEEKNAARNEFIFAFSPAIIFFMFHVVAWWQGIFASDGEVRIIAGIIPLTAIVANRGLNFVVSFLPDKGGIKKIFLILACGLLVYMPVKKFGIPLQTDEDQKMVYAASMFVKTNYPATKVFYVDPLVSVTTGRDPYDMKLIQQWFPNPDHPEEGLNDGDLVIWDAHFCPNEGHAPLQNFLNNNHFIVVKYLKPDVPFKVLGGYDYEVYVFQKKLRTQEIFSKDTIYYNGFEAKSSTADSLNYSSSVKNSGSYSFQLDAAHVYSPGLDITFDNIKDKNVIKLNASAMIYLSEPEEKKHTSLIISFDRNDKPYNYNSVNLSDSNVQPGKWNEIKLSATLPNDIKETDKIKVYIWFQGKKPIYIDDLKVALKKINIDK